MSINLLPTGKLLNNNRLNNKNNLSISQPPIKSNHNDVFNPHFSGAVSSSLKYNYSKIPEHKLYKSASNIQRFMKANLAQKRLNTKPLTEMQKIRAGNVWRVRQHAELNPQKLITFLDRKINNIKPTEVQAIIDSFSFEKKEAATKIFKRLTQFGNMNSLNAFNSLPNKHILKDDFIGLNTTLRYLQSKNNFKNLKISNPNKGQVLLDKITLERLKTDPKFLEKVKTNNNISLVYPEGFINGINPFNQHEDIHPKIVKVLETLDKFPSDDAIFNAINKPIMDELENLGLKHKVTVFQHPKDNSEVLAEQKAYMQMDERFITKQRLKPQMACPLIVRKIAKQMESPSIKIDELNKELRKIFDEPDSSGIKRSKQHYLEVLAHSIEVLSTKKLSIKLKKLNKIIMQQIEKEGIKPEDVYYYVPKPHKSYSLIAMQYQRVNNIPVDHFIVGEIGSLTNIEKIPKNCKKIVIVDDIAASGSSLIDLNKDIKIYNRYKPNNPLNVLMAPLLCSQEAEKIFAEYKVPYVCQKKISPFNHSQYYGQTTFDNADKFKASIGNSGLTSAHYNIAFPYMAPDNNSKTFALFLAKYFTFNQHGVKNI